MLTLIICTCIAFHRMKYAVAIIELLLLVVVAPPLRESAYVNELSYKQWRRQDLRTGRACSRA